MPRTSLIAPSSHIPFRLETEFQTHVLFLTQTYLLSFSRSSLSLSSLRFRRSWFLFSCFSATTLFKMNNLKTSCKFTGQILNYAYFKLYLVSHIILLTQFKILSCTIIRLLTQLSRIVKNMLKLYFIMICLFPSIRQGCYH